MQSTKKWKARVVYGDTDRFCIIHDFLLNIYNFSMFLLLKGVSKDESFKIGKEICAAVTHDNPVPIKLKFEKVPK